MGGLKKKKKKEVCHGSVKKKVLERFWTLAHVNLALLAPLAAAASDGRRRVLLRVRKDLPPAAAEQIWSGSAWSPWSGCGRQVSPIVSGTSRRRCECV